MAVSGQGRLRSGNIDHVGVQDVKETEHTQRTFMQRGNIKKYLKEQKVAEVSTCLTNFRKVISQSSLF